MDKLYIADIPTTYHYARFGSNYIELFDRPSAINTTLTSYRLYNYNNTYLYTTQQVQFSSYNTTYFTDIPVTNGWAYRGDFPLIMLTLFISVVAFVFFFNIGTSMVKKGGVFHGYLG